MDCPCRFGRACRWTKSSSGSNQPSGPARALAIWKVLTDVPAEASCSPGGHRGRPSSRGDAIGPRGDGWDGFPVHGTYAQGVAWIVMVLARALHYAHGKLTYHRDVKPANVLLTVQDGPQLLDFNLAESPHSADRARAALHGGTPPYMAPEQIEAFLNPELWGQVGAQADIYSLGLVFRELLTGQMPELPSKKLSPLARAARPARPQTVPRRRRAPVQSVDPPFARGDRRQVPGPLAHGPLCQRRGAGPRHRAILEASAADRGRQPVPA